METPETGMYVKQRARRAVRQEVAVGRLIVPQYCERCSLPSPRGRDGRRTIQAHHHNGYENALDIKWLCMACHTGADGRPKGEKNGRSKLTEAQVIEIRERARRGESPKHFCREYDVSNVVAYAIVHRQMWAHVPDEVKS